MESQLMKGDTKPRLVGRKEGCVPGNGHDLEKAQKWTKRSNKKRTEIEEQDGLPRAQGILST